VRAWLPALLVACSNEPSRLDGLTGSRLPSAELPSAGPPSAERPRDAAPPLDETEQDLQRKLRELTARPLAGGAIPPGIPLDRASLGERPRPFGPLAPLAPGMTRAEVRAAVPSVVADGTMLWVATGIDDTTAELSFDGVGRLAAVVYRLPLSARQTLVLAWGAPVLQTNTWFDRERGWRAKLDEDAVKGKVVVTMSGFTPFAALLGRGPDGLAEAVPLVGAALRELRDRLGARLAGTPAPHGFAELAMPRSTDLCGAPTELGLELDGAGVATRAILLQCYDDADVNRRAALAAMEQQWGPATPRRTKDDRLVFAWTLPARPPERPAERLIEAQQVAHDGQWRWEVAIRAR